MPSRTGRGAPVKGSTCGGGGVRTTFSPRTAVTGVVTLFEGVFSCRSASTKPTLSIVSAVIAPLAPAVGLSIVTLNVIVHVDGGVTVPTLQVSRCVVGSKATVHPATEQVAESATYVVWPESVSFGSKPGM